MSFNKITIVGYLGRDPQLHYSREGTPYCRLSVATTEKRKNQAGGYDDHTTWFNVTSFGRQAEAANEYLSKGRQVYIEGRLCLETYTDRNTGESRYSLEVAANDIQFLGRASDSSSFVKADLNDESDTDETDTNEVDDPPPPKPPKKRGAKKTAAPDPMPPMPNDNEVPF